MYMHLAWQMRLGIILFFVLLITLWPTKVVVLFAGLGRMK